MDNKSLGSRGEEAAAVYLMRHGYEILERNFRVSTGEIDIVAVTGNTLVFAEVSLLRQWIIASSRKLLGQLNGTCGRGMRKCAPAALMCLRFIHRGIPAGSGI